MCRELIKSKCLYVCCYGVENKLRHNSIDLAFVKFLEQKKIKMTDDNHIISTEAESFDDAVWTFFNNSNYGYQSNPFRKYLILFVSDGKNELEFKRKILGKK